MSGLKMSKLINPSLILKIIEVCLGIVCVGLWRYGAFNTPVPIDDIDKLHLTVVTFGGFLLISASLLVCHLLDEDPFQNSIECIINPVGFILYLATACIFLDFYGYTHPTLNPRIVMFYTLTPAVPYSELQAKGLAIGAFSVINSIVYVIDALLAFRNRALAYSDSR